ncbi:MarR family winged helix-turn-helix transcriptional regulator [Demetria terragena]|uniref:MarR family winged helix-turn-helix transcriptional regulator n=1 Tax=Demetria terragena TaxID=63959 RepID=UPI000366066C|nr:MarR family transcriptional regulator [Demetria terragena]
MDSGQPAWLDAREQAAWRAYLRASRQLWVALDRDLQAAFGISLAEYEVLSMVSEADRQRLRMSALAEIVVQSRSRLTHTAKRLEQRDLVTRRSATDDRRGVELTLTTAGAELLDGASTVHVQGVRRYLVDILAPAEFAELGSFSARISEQLGDAAEAPRAGEGF